MPLAGAVVAAVAIVLFVGAIIEYAIRGIARIIRKL